MADTNTKQVARDANADLLKIVDNYPWVLAGTFLGGAILGVFGLLLGALVGHFLQQAWKEAAPVVNLGKKAANIVTGTATFVNTVADVVVDKSATVINAGVSAASSMAEAAKAIDPEKVTEAFDLINGYSPDDFQPKDEQPKDQSESVQPEPDSVPKEAPATVTKQFETKQQENKGFFANLASCFDAMNGYDFDDEDEDAAPKTTTSPN